MSSFTPNYNLEKPDAGDAFSLFRALFNSNMDIIDQNLGGGGGGSSTLAGLTDVMLTTPVTNDALVYDGAEWTNTPLADVALSGDYNDLTNKPTIPTTLGALNDVTIAGQTTGEVLQYDGSKWVNGSLAIPSNLGDLSNVNITTPIDGEVLKYDSNSGEWINTSDNVGDTVTWNEIQNTGVKIAEISINGTSYDVYAPTGGGDSVSWTQIQASGTKIAEIDINGTVQNVYAPTGGSNPELDNLLAGLAVGRYEFDSYIVDDRDYNLVDDSGKFVIGHQTVIFERE